MEYRPTDMGLKMRFKLSFWGGEIYVYNKYDKEIDVIEISDYHKEGMKNDKQWYFKRACKEWIGDNISDLEDLECR